MVKEEALPRLLIEAVMAILVGVLYLVKVTLDAFCRKELLHLIEYMGDHMGGRPPDQLLGVLAADQAYVSALLLALWPLVFVSLAGGPLSLAAQGSGPVEDITQMHWQLGGLLGYGSVVMLIAMGRLWSLRNDKGYTSIPECSTTGSGTVRWFPMLQFKMNWLAAISMLMEAAQLSSMAFISDLSWPPQKQLNQASQLALLSDLISGYQQHIACLVLFLFSWQTCMAAAADSGTVVFSGWVRNTCVYVLLPLFIGPLFMPGLHLLLASIDCTYTVNQDTGAVVATLDAFTSLHCWEGIHIPVAFLSLVGLPLYWLRATSNPINVLFINQKPNVDLKFQPHFQMVVNFLKTLLCMSAVLLSDMQAGRLLMGAWVTGCLCYLNSAPRCKFKFSRPCNIQTMNQLRCLGAGGACLSNVCALLAHLGQGVPASVVLGLGWAVILRWVVAVVEVACGRKVSRIWIPPKFVIDPCDWDPTRHHQLEETGSNLGRLGGKSFSPPLISPPEHKSRKSERRTTTFGEEMGVAGAGAVAAGAVGVVVG